MKSNARLVDMPEAVLEQICGLLPYHDMVALFYTCKQLLLFGTTNSWCKQQLAALDLNLDDDSVDPLHLVCWLQSQRAGIRRLRFVTMADTDTAEVGLRPMILLGALGGSPLISLAVDMERTYCNLVIGSWVRAFPKLRHLQASARWLTVRAPLAQLTALTSLALLIEDPDDVECLRLTEGCLPASLRHLHLEGCDEVAEAVKQAIQLEQLSMKGLCREELQESMRLGSLTNLTALRVEGWLTSLPVELTSLQRLQILDLWGNELSTIDDDDRLDSLVLSSLSQLERLYLHYSTNDEVHRGMSLPLPRLKVLSLSICNFASFPELVHDKLEKLELDLELAARSCGVFPLMTNLQELRLRLYRKLSNDEETQAFLEELPRLWDTLSHLGRLQGVWVSGQAVRELVGEAGEEAAQQQWERQLGSIPLRIGADYSSQVYYVTRNGLFIPKERKGFDLEGFHHDFVTAWDKVE